MSDNTQHTEPEQYYGSLHVQAEAHQRRTSRLRVLVVCIFGAIGIAFLGLSIVQTVQTAQLHAAGIQIQAAVTNTSSVTSSKGGTTDTLTYVYGVGGVMYTKHETVPAALYDTYQNVRNTQPITVIYLPDNPAVAQIVGNDPDTWLGFGLAAVFLFGALASLFVPIGRSHR